MSTARPAVKHGAYQHRGPEADKHVEEPDMPRPDPDPRHSLDALVKGTTAGLTQSQVEEVTRYLERRLTDIGAEGDCAYERAMGNVYLQLIGELRSARRPLLPGR